MVNGKVSSDVQYAELMNQIRHLGTLRFAMLGVYVAITAALFAVRFGSAAPPPTVVQYASKAGMAFGVIFAFFEAVSSHRYAGYAQQVVSLEGSDGPIFGGRNVRWLGRVTIPTLMIYVGLVWFWFSIEF